MTPFKSNFGNRFASNGPGVVVFLKLFLLGQVKPSHVLKCVHVRGIFARSSLQPYIRQSPMLSDQEISIRLISTHSAEDKMQQWMRGEERIKVSNRDTVGQYLGTVNCDYVDSRNHNKQRRTSGTYVYQSTLTKLSHASCFARYAYFYPLAHACSNSADVTCQQLNFID